MATPAPETTPPAASAAPQAGALAALVLGSALLAFGPMLVRLSDSGPVASAFWRMALAAPVLVLAAVILNRRESAPLRAGQLPLGLAFIAGAFFAADLTAWHSGIMRTTSANATLFANTTAFMLAGWAILSGHERPGGARLAALALAAAGALLLFGTSASVSPQNLAGDLLSLLAAAFYTGYLMAVMRLRGRFSTLTVLAMSTLSSALLLLPAALIEPAPFFPRDWRPVIGLALSSQLVGQGLMVFASGRLPAFIVGLGLLVQPLVSAAAGWIVFNERLGPLEMLGAALVAIALVLVRR
ncbi:DMT family transporter [Sandaracinobacteroides sp. A072]|uniref:DMT family transporter n=1 Tax=Sandaracinobacteroides sp. A072 TaxID=3461146 RepID=UPI0040430623